MSADRTLENQLGPGTSLANGIAAIVSSLPLSRKTITAIIECARCKRRAKYFNELAARTKRLLAGKPKEKN